MAAPVLPTLLVLPCQLFETAIHGQWSRVVIHMHPLLISQFRFHAAKLRLHEQSVAAYADRFAQLGVSVEIVRGSAESAVAACTESIVVFDPSDDWIERDWTAAWDAAEKSVQVLDSPMFVTSRAQIDTYFDGRKRASNADFYMKQRKRLGLLLTPEGGPIGGKWSFDTENRKRIPKSVKTPSRPFDYPTTHQEASEQFEWFLATAFREFGPYEDAMRSDETWLFHSVLTPALNTGLITPDQVIKRTIEFAEQNQIPIASAEGFLRQIIGWREFIRGTYRHMGRVQRTKNFFGFRNQLPESFWDGSTGLLPVDVVIRRVQTTGYCHHIERLMVLGCIMLLLEIDPDQVYAWFMSLFIDAYDWVMVPNVYGMSQFADGGLITTKPYLCGSSYLSKMGDFTKGDWCEDWDALYWRFIHVHRSVFASNPRSGVMVKLFDGFPEARRAQLLSRASGVFHRLKLSEKAVN